VSETVLMEQTRHLLEVSLLGEQDVDTKVRLLLEAEYVRTVDLRREAQEALERIWLVQSLEEAQRTDST
jgi:hypothetical protein